MEITMADSTNDLYQLQVSPLASSSEGGYFFIPTLVFHWSIGWRQGSAVKECLEGPGETRVGLQKETQPLPDGFGCLELSNGPG